MATTRTARRNVATTRSAKTTARTKTAAIPADASSESTTATDHLPTEAELTLAGNLAIEANTKAWLFWDNYVRTGDHGGIVEQLGKLAIDLTEALQRTPAVKAWLVHCNAHKEPRLDLVGREFLIAHEAALAIVCMVATGVLSETQPTPNRRFDRRILDGWNSERLGNRIVVEATRAIHALPRLIAPERSIGTTGGTGTVEQRALAVLVVHQDWTIKQIAEEVGTRREYLSSKDCPLFKAARAALRASGLPPGTKGKDGSIEAVGDDDLDFDAMDARMKNQR